MSEKNSNINSMQDVYSTLNVKPESSYEEVTQNYHDLLQECSGTSTKDLKKAYKLMGVIYGQVEYSNFSEWYHNLAQALSKISSEFKLYEGNVERISLIDYLEPEIFLDAYLKNYTPTEFAKEFYANPKTKSLIEEASRGKKDIESSLERMSSFY